MSTVLANFADYTAQVAASIPGVKSVYGSGTGLFADPLRPGQKIASCPDNPVDGTFEHWSEIPILPSGIPTATQDGAVQGTVMQRMRLYVPRGALAVVRQILTPFYDRYAAAFATDQRLGGLCLTSNFVYMSIETPTAEDGGQHAWLEMRLACLVLYSP
jgi:hypothetical protein